PILVDLDVWYSPAAADELQRAQFWHLDDEDTSQVKVWIHLHDVGPGSGPLTGIAASISEAFADWMGYDRAIHHRIPDEQIGEFVDSACFTAFDGPAGTVTFVDTARCFHFGSRVARGA